MNGPTGREIDVAAMTTGPCVHAELMLGDAEVYYCVDCNEAVQADRESAGLRQQLADARVEAERLAYRKALLAVEACDQMPAVPHSEYIKGRADAYARASRAIESLYDGLAAGVVDNPEETP